MGRAHRGGPKPFQKDAGSTDADLRRNAQAAAADYQGTHYLSNRGNSLHKHPLMGAEFAAAHGITPDQHFNALVAQAAYFEDFDALQSYMLSTGLASNGWTIDQTHTTSARGGQGMVMTMVNNRTGDVAIGLRGSSMGSRGGGTAFNDWITENIAEHYMGGRNIADGILDAFHGQIDIRSRQTKELETTMESVIQMYGRAAVTSVSGHSRGGAEVHAVLKRFSLPRAEGYTYNALMATQTDHGKSEASNNTIHNLSVQSDVVHNVGFTDNMQTIHGTHDGFMGNTKGSHDLTHFTGMKANKLKSEHGEPVGAGDFEVIKRENWRNEYGSIVNETMAEVLMDEVDAAVNVLTLLVEPFRLIVHGAGAAIEMSNVAHGRRSAYTGSNDRGIHSREGWDAERYHDEDGNRLSDVQYKMAFDGNSPEVIVAKMKQLAENNHTSLEVLAPVAMVAMGLFPEGMLWEAGFDMWAVIHETGELDKFMETLLGDIQINPEDYATKPELMIINHAHENGYITDTQLDKMLEQADQKEQEEDTEEEDTEDAVRPPINEAQQAYITEMKNKREAQKREAQFRSDFGFKEEAKPKLATPKPRANNQYDIRIDPSVDNLMAEMHVPRSINRGSDEEKYSGRAGWQLGLGNAITTESADLAKQAERQAERQGRRDSRKEARVESRVESRVDHRLHP